MHNIPSETPPPAPPVSPFVPERPQDPNAPDPMSSFRPGTDGWVRLTFNEGRAVWRDLASLVPDASGKLRTLVCEVDE